MYVLVSFLAREKQRDMNGTLLFEDILSPTKSSSRRYNTVLLVVPT
jgi:hypothetical protein